MPTRRLLALAVIGLTWFGAACGGAAPSSGVAAGREVYASRCSACHGASGQGGVGPSLAAVTATWPECSDHIRWVTLGSDGWRAEFGDMYGATAKPVQGGMPPHGSTLSPDEIAAVAAFERITYGGADEVATLAACGVEAG